MDRETYRRAHLIHKETDRENKRQLAKERQETKQRYLKSMDENLETTRSYCEMSLSIIKGASPHRATQYDYTRRQRISKNNYCAVASIKAIAFTFIGQGKSIFLYHQKK